MMASASPDEPVIPPRLLTRRRRRGWLYGSGTIVLMIGGLWLLRAPLADNFVADQLDQRGVKAQYEIETIGPRTQTLTNVIIGNPARPDLRARRVEVDVGWSWSGPVVSAIRADGVRVQGRWVNGRLSLGEVDKLLPPPSDEPFALPDITVALNDARGRFETPWGVFGGRVDGHGPLRRNFRGQVALVSEMITAGECKTGRVSAYGTLRIVGGRPRFAGPVRAGSINCPENGMRIARIDTRIDASLSDDFKQWSGGVDLAAAGLWASGASLRNGSGTVAFAGGAPLTTLQFNLKGTNAQFADILVGSAQLKGSAKWGDVLGGDASLIFTKAMLPPQYRGRLERSVAALAGSPVGPIADQLARSAGQAMANFSGQTELALTGGGDTRRIDMIAPTLTSASGARLSGDTASRLSVLLGARKPLFLVDGRWQLSGGGMPAVAVALQRNRDGSLNGRANFAPLVAGPSRLALTPVTISGDRRGMMRLASTASLSGPIAGGRIDGLSMRIDARIQPNGDFALTSGCQRVALTSAAFAGVRLGSNAVQLCSARGAPLLAVQGGRIAGELALIAPVIRGRTGDSALSLRAARLQYGLSSGLFRIDDFSAMVGEEEAATNFTATMIAGRLANGQIAGQIAGGAGEIGTIPLTMADIAGEWQWQENTLKLAGGLLVSDQASPARFNPLISQDASLIFTDGRITATAAFAEQASGKAVGRADIAHDFANAAGSADLTVAALRFNDQFQPVQLSRLALGVIANVRGTVAGRGRIDWSGGKVTSSGTFTTAGSDFAAAFGPVRGATTTISFDDLLALHTPPAQRISLDEINPGFPVIGGMIDYQMLDATRIRIEGGRWPFAGGELRLKPTTLDFDVNAVRRLEFELSGVDAAVFMSELGFDNINASGIFDGILPVEFSGLGGRIVDGRLVARAGGGEVAYVGELTNYNLGVYANYAFDMLKSLSYDDMTITLNGDLDGEMLTEVKIVGLGQGAGARRNIITRQIEKLPIIFNVRINAPFRQLIGSAKSLYDPSILIDQNRDALIQAQRAAEVTPVQPGESEPVP